MFSSHLRPSLARSSSYFSQIIRRNFLSESYSCNVEWDKRLDDPLLKKIKPERYYYELDRKFTSQNVVSAVDMDVFANRVTESDQLNDLEELIHRFRRTPATKNTFESMSHAVICAFLQHNKTDDLMRILNDRVNYGIFPEYFTCNILMNEFLKKENYRDAAKVATFLMLEEDFSHSLCNVLALYSCHMYVKYPQPEPWDPDMEPEKTQEEDDEEETWIRVQYVYEPYFDDHFDLRDRNHLIGKTLALFGKQRSDAVGVNSQILGWTLFEKWEKLKICLEETLKSNEKALLYKDCLEKVEKCLTEISVETAKSFVRENVFPLMEQLKASGKIKNEDIFEDLKIQIKEEIQQHETKDVQQMKRKFLEWTQNRHDEINKQIAEYHKKQRIAAMKEKLNEMKEKEEVLFFFENIEKHRLNIPPEEEDEMVTETGKISKHSLLDVPPEIEGKTGRYSKGIIEEHEPWWRWEENKVEEEKK